jgi:hypothetical protein
MLTASPRDWLHDQVASAGAASGRRAWPLDPEDAGQLSGLAGMVVAMARQLPTAASALSRRAHSIAAVRVQATCSRACARTWGKLVPRGC